MLKVLYIVSTLENKGPTNQLYNIITNLDKKRFNPIILTLSPEKSQSQYEKFCEAGIQVSSLNLSRKEGLFKGHIYLKREVKRINPDIIHTQGLRADTLSAKYLKNFKRICTLRNYPYDDYPMKFGKLKGNLMAFQHLKAIKNIDAPIVCSKTLADQVDKNLNIRLTYIQNGINSKEYSSSLEDQKEYYRKKLKINVEKDVFISVGSLIKRKDPISVIKAFKNRSNKEKSILIMIGDGPLRKECEEYAKGDEGIFFTGQISNVSNYLKAANFFISASLSEGLPNTVLEALSVGLPCCLSDIEPHKEILNINKNAGILFQTDNTKSLEDVIEKIQTINYSFASLEARSIIDNHLSGSIMSKKYQELYLRLNL